MGRNWLGTFRQLATLLAAFAALAVSCSSDGESAATSTPPPATAPGSSSAAPSTRTAPATTVAPTTTLPLELVSFAEPGPFDVGVITIDLGDRQAEVWYPAVPDPEAEPEIFDSLTAFPENLRSVIPEELSGLVETGAYRDAPVADDDGPYSLVIYSHGFGGFRQVATNYTTHLASWGYVVASTDHLERGLAAQAAAITGGGGDLDRPENQDVLDVLATIDAVTQHPALGTFVDAEHIAITGHSAGAGTAARAAAEEPIDVYISISGGAPDTVSDKPAVVIAAELDAVVAADRSRALYERLTADAVLVNIEAAGHNSFTDSCAGIYEMGGLDALADLIGEDQVERAEDGCVEPFIRPDAAQAVLNHYSVAFLRAEFLDGPAAATAEATLVAILPALTPLAAFETK